MRFKISILLAALLVLVTTAGIVTNIYDQETENWAAQGKGQDIITLAVSVPLLIITGYVRSPKAYLVWLGNLFYILYSYVLYGFFVHFGPMFPVYIAILGLTFYTIIISLASRHFHIEKAETRGISIYLLASALLFSLMWIGEIMSGLRQGTLPGMQQSGLIVNPVHVMDLAFILPGMLITSILLYRKNQYGYFFAGPLVVFAAVMLTAIISMMISVGDVSVPLMSFLSLLAATGVVVLYRFLGSIQIKD